VSHIPIETNSRYSITTIYVERLAITTVDFTDMDKCTVLGRSFKSFEQLMSAFPQLGE
jgi:hypothetical protein